MTLASKDGCSASDREYLLGIVELAALGRVRALAEFESGCGDVRWPSVVATAFRSRVAPIVGWLYGRTRSIAPEWVLEAVRAAHIFHQRRNEALFGEFGVVARALDDAGVPMLARKGVSIAGAYPDAGMRGFNDIDVLIPKRSAKMARSVLEGLGFTNGTLERGKRLTPISREEELWFALATSALPTFAKLSDVAEVKVVYVDLATAAAPPVSGWSLEFDALYERSVAEPRLAPTRQLDPADLVVDLAMNLFVTGTTRFYLVRRRYERLVQYVDLVVALDEGPSEDELLERATAAGAVDALAYALGNLRLLFPTVGRPSLTATLLESRTTAFLDEYGGWDRRPGRWQESLPDRVFGDVAPP